MSILRKKILVAMIVIIYVSLAVWWLFGFPNIMDFLTDFLEAHFLLIPVLLIHLIFFWIDRGLHDKAEEPLYTKKAGAWALFFLVVIAMTYDLYVAVLAVGLYYVPVRYFRRKDKAPKNK